MNAHPVRKLPFGAEIAGDGVSFRVWAPDHERVTLVVGDEDRHPMKVEKDGFFSLTVPGIGAGTLYGFLLGEHETLLPDPASRFQPEGARGRSEVVDPGRFKWSDKAWKGILPEGQVLYEMHLGTFTPEGTWRAAEEKLAYLKDLGITTIEMMPIGAWSGQYGWGYDVVLPYAPHAAYGNPDEVRHFIDIAHSLGIGIILDVVYNHFGIDHVAPRFAEAFHSHRPQNEWGRTINFDGEDAGPVREFVALNAASWIGEYHFDGLRIDATQALLDDSDEHIVAKIVREARAAAGERAILIVSENEHQDARLVRPPEAGGYGGDGLWNDDFHHSARVALTGRSDAYLSDYTGQANELVAAAKYGYLFQGQRYDWHDAVRGTPALDLPPTRFVHYIQNHDQIANTPSGRRMGQLTSVQRLRAMTVHWLLSPQTPMLFQGQEFNAQAPFFYFLDQAGEVGDSVRKGRLKALSIFPPMQDPAMQATLPDPGSSHTFERCKIDWTDMDRNRDMLALHQDLLAMRRTHKAFASQPSGRKAQIDGGVLSPSALILRYFSEAPEDERVVLLNLGSDIFLRSIPDPLFAPPPALQWSIALSSEDAAYGGTGRHPADFQRRWRLPGETALVLQPTKGEGRAVPPPEELSRWQEILR